jgi:hypothetical protein
VSTILCRSLADVLRADPRPSRDNRENLADMAADLSHGYRAASISDRQGMVHGAGGPVTRATMEKRGDRVALMTPRQQAEAAWRPGSRYSVDELEGLIRHHRGGIGA